MLHRPIGKRVIAKQLNISRAEETCWQSALTDRGDRLANMYKLSKFSDLTISFPGRQENLKVHRLVLSMSSPVFEVMLYGPMAEGETLELPADPPEAFKWLMDYIYCGITQFPDFSTAVLVYHLGNKYQMEAVSSICSKFLQENLNATNLPLIYDTALLMEDKPLQHKCCQIVKGSAEAVLKSSHIGQLSKNCMEHLLQQDLYVSSEVSVFKGLVNWGQLNSNRDASTNEAHSDLRQTIEELLPRIRFLTMTLDEFVEHVIPSNVLTSEECTAILMNIRKFNAATLPKICSQALNKRMSFNRDKIHRVCLEIDYYNSGRNSNNHSRGYYENQLYDTDTRQRIISQLTVTKDIILKNIIFQNHYNLNYQRWMVEIEDSSGTILGEIKLEYKTADVSRGQIAKDITEASFETPVFLSSSETYDIWVHCCARLDLSNNICTRFQNLKIRGCLHYDVTPEIHFWLPNRKA